MTAGYPFQVGEVKPVAPLWYFTVKPLATEEKTLVPIVGAFPLNIAFVRLVQPENTWSPMLMTLEGMVAFVKPVQRQNARLPMLMTPEGIVMLVRPLQLKNATNPILVTLEGIVTLVRTRQSANALVPMLVTGLPLMVGGMSTIPSGQVIRPVIVIEVPVSVYLKFVF